MSGHFSVMMRWAFLLVLIALALPAAAGEDDRYASLVRVAGSGGVILHADRADWPRAPASLTKLMTLYMLFEAVDQGHVSLDDQVTISTAVAATPPVKIGLSQGDRVPLDLLMRATAIHSANDAAVAIAEHLSGSEEVFAGHMTRKARALGLTRTRFLCASGLPREGQVTTARDMALLSDVLIRDFPHYQWLFRETGFTYDGRQFRTTNGFLWSVEGADGLKTGYTHRSGYNLAASATRDGQRIIAIVLGGTGTRARNAHAAALVDAAFDRLEALRAPSQVEPASPQVTGPVDRLLRKQEYRAWGVRFGGERSHGEALDLATGARRMLPREAALAEPGSWHRSDGVYLAELTGFTAEGATQACRVLPGLCVIVPPAQ